MEDLTPNLPLRFKHINEIAFAGSTVYVATDTGVLTSVDGEHWRAITDKEGAHVGYRSNRCSRRGDYGAGDKGVYQLNNRSRWEQILPEVPDRVISFVINNDKLYIATNSAGCFTSRLKTKTINVP